MHTKQKHQAFKALKDLGYTSRNIAQMVLGDASKKSTVNDYLSKVNNIPAWPFGEQLKDNKAENCFSDLVDDLGYYSKKPYKQETVETVRYKGFNWGKEHINQRVLLISDLHVPFHHQDALEFLEHLKNKYKPTRVICLGDEVSLESNSYHEKNPDMPAAGCELKLALPVIAKLHKMFPLMDILDSNHGSLVYRKAKTHGIPVSYIKSYNEVLKVDAGWKWHNDMTIDLPNGQQCYICHGKSTDVLKLSKNMGMSAVQGHYHSSLGASYWANTRGLYFGLQAGCLIDHHSLAFKYNALQLNRPLLGSGLIIDSLPVVEPMVLDANGRWVGRTK